jgi:hypothetical protein
MTFATYTVAIVIKVDGDSVGGKGHEVYESPFSLSNE